GGHHPLGEPPPVYAALGQRGEVGDLGADDEFGGQHTARRPLADDDRAPHRRVAGEVRADAGNVRGFRREVELLGDELTDLRRIRFEPPHTGQELDDAKVAACTWASDAVAIGSRSNDAKSSSGPAPSSARSLATISSNGRGGSWSCSPSSSRRNSSGNT